MAQIVSNISPGCRVTITTLNKSKYTGLLHLIDETAGKIVLKSVSVGGVKLYGPQHFFASDITDLEFLNDVGEIGSESKPKSHKNRGKLTRNKSNPSHLAKLQDFNTDELVMVNNIFNDENEDQGAEDIFEDFYETESYTLICRVCSKFYDAVVYIMEQEVVGMTFEGVDIGRDGTLSLIQVATDTEVIIFDILRLGEQAFKEGLHALLESKDILKVIHDCRWISDLVQHQYGIDMYNIFDTQVANAFVYRTCNGGDWPRYVESLPGCLVNHLDLSQEQVHFMKIRQRHEERDKTVWLERPLSEKLLSAVHKNVSYLIRLHNVLLSKMLLEFKTGVEIYLNHINNMGSEIKKCRVNSHLLPYAFTDLPKYMRYSNQTERKDGPYPEYDSRGFRENCVDISDKRIIFSHDSVWHKGQETITTKPAITSADKKVTGTPNTQKQMSRRQSPKACSNENNSASPKKNFSGSKSTTKRSTGHKKGSSPCFEGTSIANQIPQHSDVVTASNVRDGAQNKNSSAQEFPFSSHEHLTEINCRIPGMISESNPEPSSSVAYNISASGDAKEHNLDSIHGNNCSQFSPSTSRVVSQENQASPVKEPSLSTATNNICKSKLWQAVQLALQEKKSSPPSLAAVEQNKSASSEHLSESTAKHIASESKESEEERLIKALQRIENLGFKQGGSRATSEKLNSKLSSHCKKLNFDEVNAAERPIPSSTPTSLEFSSPFEASGKRSAPTSSENESSPLSHDPSELDLKRDKALESLGFVPAGFEQHSNKKKNGKRWQQDNDLRRKLEADSPEQTLPAPADEDLGMIPMQHSLRRQKELPLGMSAIGIGDPFSEDESLLSQPKSTQSFIKSHLTFNKADSIRDEDIDCFHQSEMVRKVLKIASSQPCVDVKKKLLPSKVKSPASGSLNK